MRLLSVVELEMELEVGYNENYCVVGNSRVATHKPLCLFMY